MCCLWVIWYPCEGMLSLSHTLSLKKSAVPKSYDGIIGNVRCPWVTWYSCKGVLSLSDMVSLQRRAVPKSHGILTSVFCPWVTWYPCKDVLYLSYRVPLQRRTVRESHGILAKACCPWVTWYPCKGVLSLSQTIYLQRYAVRESNGIPAKVCCPWVTWYPCKSVLSVSKVISLQRCAVRESRGFLAKVCCPWATWYPCKAYCPCVTWYPSKCVLSLIHMVYLQRLNRMIWNNSEFVSRDKRTITLSWEIRECKTKMFLSVYVAWLFIAFTPDYFEQPHSSINMHILRKCALTKLYTIFIFADSFFLKKFARLPHSYRWCNGRWKYHVRWMSTGEAHERELGNLCVLMPAQYVGSWARGLLWKGLKRRDRGPWQAKTGTFINLDVDFLLFT